MSTGGKFLGKAEARAQNGVSSRTFTVAGAARIGRARCSRCDRRRIVFSAVLTPGSPTGCAECLRPNRIAAAADLGSVAAIVAFTVASHCPNSRASVVMRHAVLFCHAEEEEERGGLFRNVTRCVCWEPRYPGNAAVPSARGVQS